MIKTVAASSPGTAVIFCRAEAAWRSACRRIMPAAQNGTRSSHEHYAHDMTTVAGGPFRSMSALGSGTALQPATTPMTAWHFTPGNWMMMVHGELKAGLSYQAGPRGVGKAQSQNWLMAMGERAWDPADFYFEGCFLPSR